MSLSWILLSDRFQSKDLWRQRRSTTLLSASLCTGLTISLTHWLLSPCIVSPPLSLSSYSLPLYHPGLSVSMTLKSLLWCWNGLVENDLHRHKHKLIKTSQNTSPLTPTSTEGSLVRAQPSRASEPCVVLKGMYVYSWRITRSPTHL